MNLRHYKLSELPKTPWKNGLGLTKQIAIYPESANFAENEFLWRVSSAEINSTNHFSIFSGFDRILIVIQGAGLVLNQTILNPLTVYRFAGEEHIACQPVEASVVDLGVIYRRDHCRADMNVFQFSQGEVRHVAFSDKVSSRKNFCRFFFCLQGSVRIENQTLYADEFVKVTVVNALSDLISVTAIVTAVCVSLHVDY